MSQSRSQVCFNFQKGFCRFGSLCKYAHVNDREVVQQFFTEEGTTKKPSNNVCVRLDRKTQEELRQFLISSIPSEKQGVVKEYQGILPVCDDSSDDENSWEQINGEYQRQLEEKYQHIPDGVFKRKFLKNIMGNFRAGKGISQDVTCSLERDATLDYKLKTERLQKMEKSAACKTMLAFRSQLPIYIKKEEILETIEENQAIVISGETGSGKTTQVAQYILDSKILQNCGSVCHIVCTQPRRISAVSVAERVADERCEKIGESVGYQIRLDKQPPRKQGSILFCTTGILLQSLQSDIALSHVSHVIIDEIHERNLDTDFVMTVLREILPQRKDLRVILMSATMNAEEFAKYFYNCPIITVPGSLYPVAEYYLEDVLSITGYFNIKKPDNRRRPVQSDSYKVFCNQVAPYIHQLAGRYGDLVIRQLLDHDSEKTNLELIQELIEYICNKKDQGAILVFLSGWDQISDLCRRLMSSPFFCDRSKNYQNDDSENEEMDDDDDEQERQGIKIQTGMTGLKFLIIPLHSIMPTVYQSQVFSSPPPGVRKIIIATNIAESSITIDDVVYIIDSGKMKVKFFDCEKNVSILQDEWVSNANAQQRRGRAGRVQRGECYHLFTRRRGELLQAFPQPEILRSSLEEIILTIKVLELGKVGVFLNRVMDSPDPKMISSSLKFLHTLHALDSEENLTPLGFHLGKLPLEPHIAKMILFSTVFSCVDPILSLAASLTFKDPFYTPYALEKELINKKIEISKGNKSDHLVLIEAFRLWENLSTKKQKEFCKTHFLSLKTLKDLRVLKGEYADSLHEMGFLPTKDTKDKNSNVNSENSSVLKAVICAALYPNVAIVKSTQKLIFTGAVQMELSTPEDGSVKLHRSTINSNQEWFESPFLMYHRKMKSSFVFLHDTTMVTSLPLILFSTKASYSECRELFEVGNGFITINCNRDLAIQILKLKQNVQKIVDAMIIEPGIVDWSGNDSQINVLRKAIEFITSEERRQQEMNVKK